MLVFDFNDIKILAMFGSTGNTYGTDSKELPPSPFHDSGGSFRIHNPDDNTPIRRMISLSGELLLITDNYTYKMQLADQIDPERKNLKLPHNVQQKIFDHGVISNLLCRILL